MRKTLEAVPAVRRRQVSLLLAGAIALAGGMSSLNHDAMLLAALVAAAGLLWSNRQWKAWILGGFMVAGGLYWSSLDPTGCSIGVKTRLVYEKLRGNLPYLGWGEIKVQLLRPPLVVADEQREVESRIQLIESKVVDGRPWELYQTGLGRFWITAPGKGVLAWIVWEILDQHDYEYGGVTVRPGDTVVDCGAHVGVFTRYALERGAGRVVAIEPDPVNIATLEANLGTEIAAGRVVLVKAGVWDRHDFMTLSHVDDNSARNSFVMQAGAASKVERVPVLPFDEIAEQLKLDRVDFIKMDIEGAERRALAGARATMQRFRPRMAISAYHLRDDWKAIPAVVSTVAPTYRISGKDIVNSPFGLATKVLFFQ